MIDRVHAFTLSERISVLHTIQSVGPGSFGLGTVALNLAREQNLLGSDAVIWCLDHDDERQWAADTSDLPSSKIRGFKIASPKVFCLSLEMERVAVSEAKTASVVHQHALWTGLSRIPAMLRKRHGIPSVISPHGALEKWALNRSSWKKQIALTLYERNNLDNVSCLHACSIQEATGFRDFGLKKPIAVIPNGISHSWLECAGNADAFRGRFNLPRDKRIMLFLSRITPVKGLPLLIEALDASRQHLDDWILVIAGSDEFGHKAEVENKIRQFELGKHVLFTGLLFGQIKRDAFEAAELFVLPTTRENYGIVVAEALGVGVPVLSTEGAPWEDLVKHRCGWWPKVSSQAIAEALSDALRHSPDQLQQMGQRGRELVAGKYTWNKAARMTIELYEWLLGRREQPDFVLFD